MAQCIMNKKVAAYLEKHSSINKDIVLKLRKCLVDYLFESVNTCDKHELKGNCKGYWRLHVPHDHVVIYTIEGTKPNRYAHIVKIMTEKEYHNWISAC